MVLIITFIGGYPIKYLLSIIGAGIVILGVFILTAKAFPGAFPHRVDTWISRVDSFTKSEVSADDNYQVNLAQQAIVSGGIIDRKSTRLNSSHVAISYAVFCLK